MSDVESFPLEAFPDWVVNLVKKLQKDLPSSLSADFSQTMASLLVKFMWEDNEWTLVGSWGGKDNDSLIRRTQCGRNNAFCVNLIIIYFIIMLEAKGRKTFLSFVEK